MGGRGGLTWGGLLTKQKHCLYVFSLCFRGSSPCLMSWGSSVSCLVLHCLALEQSEAPQQTEVRVNESQTIQIMCTQKGVTFMINLATGQSRKRTGNYLPFVLQRLFLEQKVITLLYTSTFLYNQETSEPFANYSSYLQGSHFLVKEATGDENPLLSGSPFKAKFRAVEWEEGPSGLTQQPPLSPVSVPRDQLAGNREK